MLLSDLGDGSSVFIDANIFIYHFSKGSKLNPASSKFLERIEEGKIGCFVSKPRDAGEKPANEKAIWISFQ
jgi:hypothetical protein